MEIRNKRKALIWNSIAITINIIVVLIYFLFVPITKASDGTMNFDYFLQIKTLALFISSLVTIAHFFITKFAMLETDCKWIVLTLTIWAMINLSVESQNGLFFSELQGSKNIIKVSLSAFAITSTSCLYLVLCQLSQKIKKVDEKEQRTKIMKTFGSSFAGSRVGLASASGPHNDDSDCD